MHSKKVVMKSQIIGVYPYTIPHFNTNKLLQAFLLYIWYCDYSARIYSNFKESKVKSICDLLPLSTTVCPSMENKIRRLRWKHII